MPTRFSYDYGNRCRKRALAAAQIRAKFPDLIEGSSGWNRAVENRLKRL